MNAIKFYNLSFHINDWHENDHLIPSRKMILKILQEIIDVYECHEMGWCRNSIAWNSSGPCSDPNRPDVIKVCILGAVNRVVNKRHVSNEKKQVMIKSIMNILDRKSPKNFHSIIDYNDQTCKSKRQLMNKIRAIKKAHGKE